MAHVSVFGAGHVGLATGACLAELGHEVVIKDVLPEKIARLAEGDLPLHEAGLDQLLVRNRARIRFTTDGVAARESADVLVICVDTPPTASGDADLTRVWAVVDDVSSSCRPAVLLMKSTVPVGTGQRIRNELDGRGLDRVGYVSNPELRPRVPQCGSDRTSFRPAWATAGAASQKTRPPSSSSRATLATISSSSPRSSR
jgi:UDPglucose 6-dehydrogenase